MKKEDGIVKIENRDTLYWTGGLAQALVVLAIIAWMFGFFDSPVPPS